MILEVLIQYFIIFNMKLINKKIRFCIIKKIIIIKKNIYKLKKIFNLFKLKSFFNL